MTSEIPERRDKTLDSQDSVIRVVWRALILRIRVIPLKRVREELFLFYELKGAQKAVVFLVKYYWVGSMRIVVDGRRIGGKYLAIYEDIVTYFKKLSLNKRTVLHEFYYHLVHNGVAHPRAKS